MKKKNKKSKTSKDDKEKDEDVEDTEAEDEEEEEEEEKASDDDSEDEDEDSEADDDDEDSEEEDDDIDFDSELEKEKKRGKPDPNKAAKAFKERDKKRKGEADEDEDEDDDDKPLTRREMREFMAGHSKVQNAGEIRRIAEGLADSDAEAEYIIEIHKNRIFPNDLSLSEQVEEAHAIANRKRSRAKTKELARALKGKKGASKSGTGGHQDSPKGPAPKVADDLKASLKRAGFNLDPKDRKWKKKLPNGKMLVKDTPTARPEVR
jgi:hypothetical protein